MNMTQEELQKLLTSFEQEVSHIKEWQIDRNEQLKSVCNNGKGGIANRDNKHGLFSLTPEKRLDASSKGGTNSIEKLIDWCKENNHWETIAEIHRGVSKSSEHKEKISKKLTGRKLPIETCKKMSESKMGHVWDDETIEKLKKSARKRMRPVIQYDLQNNFIKEWGGFAEIVDELKLEKGGIYLSCKGKINKSQGYIWKYKDEIQ